MEESWGRLASNNMTMEIIWTTQANTLEMEQLFYNSIDINIDSGKITSFMHAPTTSPRINWMVGWKLIASKLNTVLEENCYYLWHEII